MVAEKQSKTPSPLTMVLANSNQTPMATFHKEDADHALNLIVEREAQGQKNSYSNDNSP